MAITNDGGSGSWPRDERIAQLEMERDQLTGEIGCLQADLEDQQKEISELRAARDMYRDERDQWRLEADTYKEALETCEAELYLELNATVPRWLRTDPERR